MTFQRIDMGDAQTPEGRRCLLIYGFSEEEMKCVESYNNSFGINDTIYITESTLDSRINNLLGNNENILRENRPPSIKERAIVFNAFSNKDIHDYINMFKEKIYLNPIFAVVTPHSIKWRFKELLIELTKERTGMNGR